MCRLCFVDVEEARRQEQSLALTRSDIEGGEEASHIIMCDTMRPPEAAECSDKCGRKKDTVSENILRACPMLRLDALNLIITPGLTASSVVTTGRDGMQVVASQC